MKIYVSGSILIHQEEILEAVSTLESFPEWLKDNNITRHTVKDKNNVVIGQLIHCGELTRIK
ncbi:MAG: hypothetical protein IJJ44_00095 [Solobacterium sp.]|nr:hypothetical protein [Solobacterium sp.]